MPELRLSGHHRGSVLWLTLRNAPEKNLLCQGIAGCLPIGSALPCPAR
jgi:hypothetical protein